MGKSGFALKFLQWFIRGVQFGCAALILGVYSYFLATLANHDLHISTSVKAVEGIAGVAVIYTAVGLLLLCCLAGRTFSSLIAIILDVAFIGAFIYVAVANRGGASSCSGYLDTPFGRGNADDTANGSGGFTVLPSFHTACRLQTACLAVSIIAIFFFCFSILMEVALVRHHKKEKRFGPGPENNYTSGYGRKPGFFGRFSRRKGTGATTGDNALPAHTTPDQLEMARESHATERTAVANETDSPYNNKYDNNNAYNNNGYSYQPAGTYGRQDGYGHVHYPEPEEHGTSTVPAQQQNYRYDDGVYNRS